MFAWIKKLFSRKKKAPPVEPYTYTVNELPPGWEKKTNRLTIVNTGRDYSARRSPAWQEPVKETAASRDYVKSSLPTGRRKNLQQLPKNAKVNRVFSDSEGRRHVVVASDMGEPIPVFIPIPATTWEEDDRPKSGGGSFSGAGASGDWDSPASTPVSSSSEPDQCTRSNYTSYTSSDDSSSSSSYNSSSSDSNSFGSSSSSDSYSSPSFGSDN